MYVEHDRRSIRLRGFDYATAGAYFVTICAFERAHIFGSIREGAMHKNALGLIVIEEWMKTQTLRPYIGMDEFVVMPNHIHGIIWIRGKARLAPTYGNDKTFARFGKPPVRSIPSIIGSFKSAVTRSAHLKKIFFGPIWQQNYYERIIRTESELSSVRKYIRDNPLNWKTDSNNEIPA